MTDEDLIALLQKTAAALDQEAVDIIDVDTDDRGRSKPSISVRDRDYFDALTEETLSLRGLIGMIQARSREAK